MDSRGCSRGVYSEQRPVYHSPETAIGFNDTATEDPAGDVLVEWVEETRFL